MWMTIAWWGMFFYSLAVSTYGQILITISNMAIITGLLSMLMVATIWASYLWNPKHSSYSDGKGIDYNYIFLMEGMGSISTAMLYAIFFVQMNILFAVILYYPIMILEGIIILGAYYNYKIKTI